MTRPWNSRRPGPTVRVCARCDQALPLASFARQSPGANPNRDGLKSYCRPCQYAAVRQWYHEHLEEVRARWRERHPRRYPQPRECAHCGAGFTAVNAGHAYCQRSCSRRSRPRPYDPEANHRKMLLRGLRRKVVARYGMTCYLCQRPITVAGSRVDLPGSFVIDHVFPASAGGLTVIENLRPAHRGCNAEKSDRPPTWWEIRLAEVAA